MTFTSFLPAMSPEALLAKCDRLREMRIPKRTDLTLDDLARWLNPIVAGWINYYARYYRVGVDPLLQRVSSYLRRWAAKKYKRCRRSGGRRPLSRIRVICRECCMRGTCKLWFGTAQL